MNAPVVVWQHGPLRIVAREIIVEETGDFLSMLTLEQREYDALKVECWSPAMTVGDDDFLVLDALLTTIVAKIDVVPSWVSKFVRDDYERVKVQDVIGHSCEHEDGKVS